VPVRIPKPEAAIRESMVAPDPHYGNLTAVAPSSLNSTGTSKSKVALLQLFLNLWERKKESKTAEYDP